MKDMSARIELPVKPGPPSPRNAEEKAWLAAIERLRAPNLCWQASAAHAEAFYMEHGDLRGTRWKGPHGFSQAC